MITQKWYVQITIQIDGNFSVTTEALIDSGANLNCISEGLIPSRYYTKTTQRLNTADESDLHIDYKLSNVVVCNNGVCFETPFILVKNMTQPAILGTPFISLLFSLSIDDKGISTNWGGKCEI